MICNFDLDTIKKVAETVQAAVTSILGIVAVCLFLLQAWLYLKLIVNEKRIKAKEDVLDRIARDGNNQLIDFARIDEQAKSKDEHKRELERLKQNRLFIKDKLWFTKR